jgi:hypothetical protein
MTEERLFGPMRTGNHAGVTTSNEGQSKFVVLDTHSHPCAVKSTEQTEAIAGIELGLESLSRGEGVSAKTVFARLRRKHKIPAEQ